MEPDTPDNHYHDCLEMIKENHPWLRDAVTSATSRGYQSQPEACEIEEQPLIIRRYALVPRTTPDVPYTDEVLAEHEKRYGKWSHRAPPTTSTAKLTNTERTEEELESLASAETFPWRPQCHARTTGETGKVSVKGPPQTPAGRSVDDSMRLEDQPSTKDATTHTEDNPQLAATRRSGEGPSLNMKGIGPDEDFWSDDEGLLDSRAVAESMARLEAARKTGIVTDNEEENRRWRKVVRDFHARQVDADKITRLKLERLGVQGLAPAMPLDRPTVLGLYKLSQYRTSSKTNLKLRGLSWTRRSKKEWDEIHERRAGPVRRSSGINEKLDAGSVEQTYIANQSEDDNDLSLSLD